MAVATLERPTVETSVIAEAMRVIQEHLDKEARNRRLTTLAPRELCPMQKAEMLQDLARLLGFDRPDRNTMRISSGMTSAMT